MNIARYLKWLAILCLLLACFGAGILLVGYKPASIGRIATIAVLTIGAIVLLVGTRKLKGRG